MYCVTDRQQWMEKRFGKDRTSDCGSVKKAPRTQTPTGKPGRPCARSGAGPGAQAPEAPRRGRAGALLPEGGRAAAAAPPPPVAPPSGRLREGSPPGRERGHEGGRDAQGEGSEPRHLTGALRGEARGSRSPVCNCQGRAGRLALQGSTRGLELARWPQEERRGRAGASGAGSKVQEGKVRWHFLHEAKARETLPCGGGSAGRAAACAARGRRQEAGGERELLHTPRRVGDGVGPDEPGGAAPITTPPRGWHRPRGFPQDIWWAPRGCHPPETIPPAPGLPPVLRQRSHGSTFPSWTKRDMPFSSGTCGSYRRADDETLGVTLHRQVSVTAAQPSTRRRQCCMTAECSPGWRCRSPRNLSL